MFDAPGTAALSALAECNKLLSCNKLRKTPVRVSTPGCSRAVPRHKLPPPGLSHLRNFTHLSDYPPGRARPFDDENPSRVRREGRLTKTIKVREPKITVSDANILKAAMRLHSQRLVSTEVHYVQRTLGTKATQQDLDDQVLAVRKLPWNAIVVPD